MILVKIEQKYTDFLFKYDCRVSYNIDKTYERPYVGVLFEIDEKKYFAPLTQAIKEKN